MGGVGEWWHMDGT